MNVKQNRASGFLFIIAGILFFFVNSMRYLAFPFLGLGLAFLAMSARYSEEDDIDEDEEDDTDSNTGREK